MRTKLLAALLIPVLAVAVLAGLRIGSAVSDSDQLSQQAARGPVDGALDEVVHQLERERDVTVRFVAAGRGGDKTELQTQRERVDGAIGGFDRQFADQRKNLSEVAVSGLSQMRDRLAGLSGLRFAGQFSKFPADAVLRSYSQLIGEVLGISDRSVAELTDPELSRLRLAASALSRVKDQMSIKRAVLAEALAQGRLNEEQLRALLGADAEQAAAREEYRTFATPEQQRMYQDTLNGLVVDIGNNIVDSALSRGQAGGQGSLAGIDPGQWDTSATYTINLARKVQDALTVQSQDGAGVLVQRARDSAIRDGSIVLGALLVAALLALLIARSLLRPLRTLRSNALEVARIRLPGAVAGILAEPDVSEVVGRVGVQPVPVFSRDELGQVARAFDAVHGEAVRLAGEQALLRQNVNTMFVNLSMRSQDLVERQLSVLDRMEAEEQDADTLGGLFELDHLATRMRRNSENLLVLSGGQLDRAEPGVVRADEIIGAALSEVEHYQRIELAELPELAVRGEAVSDLVHVLSELLENATRYSAEENPVAVHSSMDEGVWQVEIVDQGVGMPAEEIELANTRLVRPPKVDVEVAQRMGLYVVATLAVRHRISVRLAAGREAGLTATVRVPAALVVGAPQPTLERSAPSTIPSLRPVRKPAPAEDVGFIPPESPVVPEPEPEDSWDEQTLEEMDARTERMPAYQDVLSRWFEEAVVRRTPVLPEPEEPQPAEDTGAAATAGAPSSVDTGVDEPTGPVTASVIAAAMLAAAQQQAKRTGKHAATVERKTPAGAAEPVARDEPTGPVPASVIAAGEPEPPEDQSEAAAAGPEPSAPEPVEQEDDEPTGPLAAVVEEPVAADVDDEPTAPLTAVAGEPAGPALTEAPVEPAEPTVPEGIAAPMTPTIPPAPVEFIAPEEPAVSAEPVEHPELAETGLDEPTGPVPAAMVAAGEPGAEPAEGDEPTGPVPASVIAAGEPVAPEPVAPQPVAAEPLAPEPPAPEPLTPWPVAPEPALPDFVAPEPTAPEPLEPPVETGPDEPTWPVSAPVMLAGLPTGPSVPGGSGPRRPVLPRREPEPPEVRIPQQEMPEPASKPAFAAVFAGDKPLLTLAPEAVRQRMSRLQHGVRRGRRERDGQNPGTRER